MGIQALQDVSQYVPRDQWTLENSGISSSDRKAVDGRFNMRWSTPYAQYLWHGDVMHGNPTNRTYGPEKYRLPVLLPGKNGRNMRMKYMGLNGDKSTRRR